MVSETFKQSHSPTARVGNVSVSDDVCTIEVEISDVSYLNYPVAPAWLWSEKANEMVFPLDQLIYQESNLLRFETYDPRPALPFVGDTHQFISLWGHWAMDAVQDTSAVWTRQNYPYPGEHAHCLLTWQTIADDSEHKDGFASVHGWVTVKAYAEYIQNDRCRIRSNWRSIERRPTRLHRMTDMARSSRDGIEGVVIYDLEPKLTVHEFIDVLRRSTLAERRPVEEPHTIAGMLAHADLIVTARRETGLLIGVSRAITDYNYCTYLSDLAVDRDFQRQGIGRELIRRTHEAAGRQTQLILLAAPTAREYYPHIGMKQHDSCWTIDRG